MRVLLARGARALLAGVRGLDRLVLLLRGVLGRNDVSKRGSRRRGSGRGLGRRGLVRAEVRGALLRLRLRGAEQVSQLVPQRHRLHGRLGRRGTRTLRGRRGKRERAACASARPLKLLYLRAGAGWMTLRPRAFETGRAQLCTAVAARGRDEEARGAPLSRLEAQLSGVRRLTREPQSIQRRVLLALHLGHRASVETATAVVAVSLASTSPRGAHRAGFSTRLLCLHSTARGRTETSRSRACR